MELIMRGTGTQNVGSNIGQPLMTFSADRRKVLGYK
jgi:hypothetical protein